MQNNLPKAQPYPYNYDRIAHETAQREEYRAKKNWFMSDILRDDLRMQGWAVDDLAEDHHLHRGLQTWWQGVFFFEVIVTERTKLERHRRLVDV